MNLSKDLGCYLLLYMAICFVDLYDKVFKHAQACSDVESDRVGVCENDLKPSVLCKF